MMAAVVAAMTLGELLGPLAGDDGDIAVTDLVSDSRQVERGAAFVALAGGRVHGLAFAADALAAGANVVLYEAGQEPDGVPGPSIAVPDLRSRLGELARRFFGRDRAPDDLIGITGTNGKTTTAWLIANGLTSVGEDCAYLGTIGYGKGTDLKPQNLTTPDCLSLHRELAEIGTETAALEVSSHALAQDRVAGLGFDVAVFTNLSHEHLDWHRSIDAYFEAKARLFERDELRSAVVNAGDEHGRLLLERLSPKVRGISVAFTPELEPDVLAQVASRGLDGFDLQVDGVFGRATIPSRLIGEFNAENLLLALVAMLARGHGLDACAAALAEAAPPPGRMEVFGGPPALPWVIVDYAHTPAALERVLAEVARLKSGELTVVFGCGGDRDRDKRAPMGRAAATYAQHIVLTDDNPRSEDPATIVRDIEGGTRGHADVDVQHDREAAIAGAIAAANAGDIIVVAGKGHETRQLRGKSSRELSDRDIVRRGLERFS